MVYLAHTKDGKNFISEEDSQLLEEHLQNVSCYAKKFASKFGGGNAGEIIGLFHDYGKFSEEFQKKIRGKKIKAPHAMSGAKLLDNNKDPLVKLYAMLIAGHHTGLSDSGNSASIGDDTYYAKLRGYSDTVLNESFGTSLLSQVSHKRLNTTHNKKQMSFSVAMYLKMLFSALVDADYTDTEEFCSGVKREPINYTIENLVHKLSEKFPVNDGRDINNIRKNILESCLEHSQDPQGLFTLTVPTGGGKTISSLTFALKHAQKHNLSRIIYVIPYTSIIEQNAKVIAELVGQEFVLEHHSNILHDSDDFRIKWATENWDIPIVVTTNVQFFESFFSNRPSNNRKLHNISNSVIIFDEAQMLPKDYLSPSLYAISELVMNYNVTAVLCSATQPRIQKYKYESLSVTEIANDPKELAKNLKRVKYECVGKKSDEDIIGMVKMQQSALVIVNSRRHAFALFNMLKEEMAENIFCLSTLIPPVLRRKRIEQIKEKLNLNERVFVISTQLIEAGVDIDFPAVFRSIAGIDSVIQAGGRANREGKLKDENGKPIHGQVFVFEPTSENGKTPRSLQNEASLGKLVIDYMGENAFELEGIEKYFDQLYFTSSSNELLDAKNILDEFEINAMKLNFKTVSDKFKLIDDNSYNIIIPVDDASKELVSQLRTNIFTKKTIRELGQFSVSVYEQEFSKLRSDGVIEDINGFYVLNNSKYYKDETGLDIFTNDNKNAEAIFTE